MLSRSVFDRNFRIKAAQPCHSDRYCSGKRPLCSGKLERTQGGNPRRQQLARQRCGSGAHAYRRPGTGGHTRRLAAPGGHWHIRQRLRPPRTGPPHRIRTFRPNAALFRSNGVVSAPMRTCEVIETNRYPFRPNAERDSDTGKRPKNRPTKPPDRPRTGFYR